MFDFIKKKKKKKVCVLEDEEFVFVKEVVFVVEGGVDFIFLGFKKKKKKKFVSFVFIGIEGDL